MTWTEGLTALIVLATFVYFIYTRLVNKFPDLQGKLGTWFTPLYNEPEIKLDDAEVKQQIWNENRVAI